MTKYTVKAIVVVDVEMIIEAETRAEAHQIFEGNIMMTAALADVSDFETVEDSISDVTIGSVSKA